MQANKGNSPTDFLQCVFKGPVLFYKYLVLLKWLFADRFCRISACLKSQRISLMKWLRASWFLWDHR